MFWMILIVGAVVAAYVLHVLTRPKIESIAEPTVCDVPKAIERQASHPAASPVSAAAFTPSIKLDKSSDGMQRTGLSSAPRASWQMSYEEHLEVAYWAVMQMLQPSDIPMSRLNDLKPKLLGMMNSGEEKAAHVLLSELADIPWDCPAWHKLPKRDRGESTTEVVADVARMKPATLLERALRSDLQSLCKTHGIRVLSKAKKPEMISALRNALSPDVFAEIAFPFGASLAAALQNSGRKDMAAFIVSRISGVARNAHRYEQLSDPEFVLLRPFWKFVWADYGEAPQACKKFNGKILPIDEAKRVFPHLPCKSRRCNCYLTAVSSQNDLLNSHRD